MQELDFIRSNYRPSQPAENAGGKGRLYYKEYVPCAALQPYVHCFWELASIGPLESAYSYRVVADGCIDLLIDNKQYNGITIAGIAGSAFDIPMTGDVSYFGIRFLPGGSRFFFRFNASEIANQMTNAGDVLDKRINDLGNLLFEKKTTAEKIEVAETFLLSRLLSLNVSLHPALAMALDHILSGKDEVTIEKGAAIWISPRQLRRLFQDHIGCSPKLFSRIVRFQQTLHAMQHGGEAAAKNAFYDHGYFDQSHFIKEFRVFYGERPGKL